MDFGSKKFMLLKNQEKVADFAFGIPVDALFTFDPLFADVRTNSSPLLLTLQYCRNSRRLVQEES